MKLSSRRNFPAIVFGVLTGVLLACGIMCATGCQSSIGIHNKTSNALSDVDASFDRIDGNAAAIEDGSQDPKVAASSIRSDVKGGKKASGKVAEGTKELLERAKKAEDALANRARNRIEWALIIAGLACWAAGGLLLYAMFSGAGVSIVRRTGVVVALGVAGAGCFAAVVYFDAILTIGLCALALVALVAIGTFVAHKLKHMPPPVKK